MKKCKQEHNYPVLQDLLDIDFYNKTVKFLELQHARKTLEYITKNLSKDEIHQVRDSGDNKKSGDKKERIVKKTLGKTVYKLQIRL